MLKRAAVIRLGIVLMLLLGILLVMASRGGVHASPDLQAVTPMTDDLANLGGAGACEEMFSTYYRWLDEGAKVRFYFVTNEDGEPNDDPTRGNVASYATGDLTYSSTDKTQLTGTGLQYFNDRNMFDPRSADKIQLTISPTSIQVVLLSWGNAVAHFTQPHCTNKALIALGEGNPNRSGSYKIMSIFTFHKE